MSVRPLRIGIDGRALRKPMGGIGRYVYGLLRDLPRWLPNVHFVAYLGRPMDLDLPGDPQRWTVRIDHAAPSWLPQTVWLKLRCGTFCRKDGLDLFWGCSLFLPELPDNILGFLTVYDLVHEVAPLTMSWSGLFANALLFNRDVRLASHVSSISRGTADRLYRSQGRNSNSIVPPILDKEFHPRSPEEINLVLGKHGIKKPYFLALATAEPRKNLVNLLQAIQQLHNEDKLGGHILVLCGRRGWKDSSLDQQLKACGERVTHLGYVPGEDIPHLLSGATALVFPTIYEGFGMPAQEAAACGTLVLAPDMPELNESAGAALRTMGISSPEIRQALIWAIDSKDYNSPTLISPSLQSSLPKAVLEVMR